MTTRATVGFRTTPNRPIKRCVPPGQGESESVVANAGPATPGQERAFDWCPNGIPGGDPPTTPGFTRTVDDRRQQALAETSHDMIWT